jgi:hypothetical protein
MTAQEIPLGYEAELLSRFEVAETILAFQFGKPSGFEFRPGQPSDLTLVNPPGNRLGRKCSNTFRLPVRPLAWVTQHLTSENGAADRCISDRPSDGSIVSAHADVSSNPRATNAAKHCWIQDAAKWFDRNQVRSRKPRRGADVDPPIQNVPVWAAHQGGTDEPVDGFVAGFTKRFSRKLVQDPKVSIQSTWRYFGVASIALRQPFQK